MKGWLLHRFGRESALCVTAGNIGRRFRPSKAFVIVIVLVVIAELALVVCGVLPTVGVQVVAAVLGSVEAVRRLTARSLAAVAGAVR
ncbi:hypothetical protein [Streptomyces sp. NPDC049949]|uniref:hypothetical protein n=1 Tax=Streptomyces sp. NPDC049949 TaxID=3154627 RepID=UPI00342639CE